MKFYGKKTKQILAGVLAVLLILAMVLPMVVSVL